MFQCCIAHSAVCIVSALLQWILGPDAARWHFRFTFNFVWCATCLTAVPLTVLLDFFFQCSLTKTGCYFEYIKCFTVGLIVSLTDHTFFTIVYNRISRLWTNKQQKSKIICHLIFINLFYTMKVRLVLHLSTVHSINLCIPDTVLADI